MRPLEVPVSQATTAIMGNQWMVAGYTNPDRKGVEYYNVDTKKSKGFKADKFHARPSSSCSIVSESKVTVFGGVNFQGGVAYQAQFGSTDFEKVTIESMKNTHKKYYGQMCATFQAHP